MFVFLQVRQRKAVKTDIGLKFCLEVFKFGFLIMINLYTVTPLLCVSGEM